LAFLLSLRKSVASPATELPASPPVASPPPLPLPAPAAVNEIALLRSEILGLRDRLRVHVMETRQPRR
ncbi:succinoglycan biosynthesis protein exop, partial [Mesorhizobium sp. M1A.T.Ca.IN.004.03.1.1]